MFFAVEFLGKSKDSVGVIGAAVIVKENPFLRFVTLCFFPVMSF